MKKVVLFLLLTGTVLATGCKNKKEVAAPATTDTAVEKPKIQAVTTKPRNENLENPPKEDPTAGYQDFPDSLFASIERTPCFGQCPIYKVKIYDSGYATYEGKKFAPREGKYVGRVDDDTRQKIAEKALSIGYFEMKEEYDGPITDLPSVITQLKINDRKKQVKARFQAPDELRGYERFMDLLLEQVAWKAADENAD